MVEFTTGRVPTVEALVRWNHPSLGHLLPNSFLSLVHDAGLSNALTEFSLTEGLQALPSLRALYGPDVAISLNLSRPQLHDPEHAVSMVQNHLDLFSESGASLRVEVVEDLTAEDLARSADALTGLRHVGVKIVLDDFGTGASSLSMLTDVGYDALKIDRSFTRRMLTSKATQSVIESVLAFARSTGTEVVVEGVETAEQVHALVDMGCLFGQGYLLSRPASIEALPAKPGLSRLTRSPSELPTSLQAIDELADAVAMVNPRNADVPTVRLIAELELLDEQAVALGDSAAHVRLEVGRRLVLASIYGGHAELVTKWALHMSRLAEQAEQWGPSAEALAMLASCPGDSSHYAGVRIESLTRAMQLRISKPMRADQISRVDNGIGAAFANLGLFSHAMRWWSDSVARHRTRPDEGTAMTCLNLADAQMQRLEGDMWIADDVPHEARVAKTYSTLAALDENPHAPKGGAGSIRCRLELSRGNIAGASEILRNCDDNSTDILSKILVLRARAMLAQARGEPDEFLLQTTSLLNVLDGNLLLQHFDLTARRLHGAALIACGHTDEGVAALKDSFQRQAANDASKLDLLFEWIRLHIDLEARFGEALELGSTAQGALTED